MEQAEVQRLDVEVKGHEEKFDNHGHKADFFQAPTMHTRIRIEQRDVNQLQKGPTIEEEEKLALGKEQAKAYARNSRFVPDESTMQAKKLVQARQAELAEIIRVNKIK